MAKKAEAQLEKVRKKRNLSSLDLCSIHDLSGEDIKLIIEIANEFKKIGNKKYTLLKDCTIFNAFFEPSTRTRASFELSGKKLSADVINISLKDTAIKKKESLLDTAETLNAMRPEVIIIRTSKAGIPHFLSKHVHAAIINAGDGWNEHPTQALLDVMTMIQHHSNLKQKVVTIVGDILHSRVFGSLGRLLPRLGARVRVVCPETLKPKGLEKVFKCRHYHNIESALKGSDVVYTLRIQEERGANGFISTLREYSKAFGISKKRFDLSNPDAILMHPGPVIRDIDIHSALVAMDESRILDQVENGLAIRSAILWLYARRTDSKVKIQHLI